MNTKQSIKRSARYGLMSVILAASVVVYHLVTGLALDSYLARMSLAFQRGIVLGAIMLAVAGIVAALIELIRERRQLLLASLGLVLNVLLALFFTAIFFIAG